MTAQIALTEDLATCLALRELVFIGEQGVSPEEERDGRDAQALHFLVRVDGHPMGTARVLITDDTAKIGRVCVLPEARGTGLGKALILACLEHLQGRPDVREARLGAQLHALGFYAALGFEAQGPIFDDAGIPHRMMVRPL